MLDVQFLSFEQKEESKSSQDRDSSQQVERRYNYNPQFNLTFQQMSSAQLLDDQDEVNEESKEE